MRKWLEGAAILGVLICLSIPAAAADTKTTAKNTGKKPANNSHVTQGTTKGSKSTTRSNGKSTKKNAAPKRQVVRKPKASEIIVVDNVQDVSIDATQTEMLILQYTNEERERRGLAPLVMDSQLMNTARRHANSMASTRNFRHSRDRVAENIAMGQGTSREAVRDWMNSSGHRANILRSSHTRIGVAAYVSRDGTVYWVQQFAN